MNFLVATAPHPPLRFSPDGKWLNSQMLLLIMLSDAEIPSLLLMPKNMCHHDELGQKMLQQVLLLVMYICSATARIIKLAIQIH